MGSVVRVASRLGRRIISAERHAINGPGRFYSVQSGAEGFSQRSVEWLDERLQARERLFRTPEDRRFVQSLCTDLFGFDAPMLGAGRVLLLAAVRNVPWAGALFAGFFPMWCWIMRAGLGLRGFGANAAAARIDRVKAAFSGNPSSTAIQLPALEIDRRCQRRADQQYPRCF